MDLYIWAILLAESSSADILFLPKDLSNLAILASDSSWASLLEFSSSAYILLLSIDLYISAALL